MTDAGFTSQQRNGDVVLVRPSSSRADIFERIEIDFAGRQGEAIVLTIAIAVVQSIKAQARGLLMRRGVPEMRTDNDEGRIVLRSKDEARTWLQSLAVLAPTRLKEFAEDCGDELLASTRVARTLAHDVFVNVLPTLRPLSAQESVLKSTLVSRPLIIGDEDVADEYERAVDALLIVGDADLISSAQSKPPRVSPPTAIHWEVPDVVLWKIRLLVDLQLRAATTGS